MPRVLDKRTIVYAIGAPEQGKTSFLRAAFSPEARRLEWLPAPGDVDWSGIVVRSRGELLDALDVIGSASAVVQFVPRYDLRAEFEDFCLGAMAWGDCAVRVEELADVSNVGKAPHQWGRVLRECRHFRLKIYASTQRPQEADKTILGIYSQLAVFWMPDAEDREYVSRKTRIPLDALDSLQALHYVSSQGRGQHVAGRLVF